MYYHSSLGSRHECRLHGLAVMVGLSLGGLVALSLLHDAPQVVDHLVVSGTAVHFSPLIASLSKLGTPLLRLLKQLR